MVSDISNDPIESFLVVTTMTDYLGTLLCQGVRYRPTYSTAPPNYKGTLPEKTRTVVISSGQETHSVRIQLYSTYEQPILLV